MATAPQQILEAVQLFLNVSSTCLGPCGRSKLMLYGQDGLDASVTGLSARLSAQITLTMHPVYRIIQQMMKSVERGPMDGGHRLMIFSCSIVRNYLLVDGVSWSEFSSACEFVMNTGLEFLNSKTCPCRVPVDFSETQPLLILVRSILQSKSVARIRPDDANYMSILLVKAFLSVVSSSESTYEHRIRFLTIPGGEMRDSMLFTGLVLDVGVPQMVSFRFKDKELLSGGGPVALFDAHMDPNDHQQQASTISHESQMMILKELLQKLIEMKVKVVACQKGIHPNLQLDLLKNGILPIQRLSIRHIQSFQTLTGAHVVSSLSSKELNPKLVGRVGKIEKKFIGDKEYIMIHPSSECLAEDFQVSTLIIRTQDEYSADEALHLFRSSLQNLSLALQYPFAFIGGGCVELHLISHVNSKLQDMSTRQEVTSHFKRSVDIITRSIKEIIRSLAVGSPSFDTELFTDSQADFIESQQKSFRSGGNRSYVLSGWNPVAQDKIEHAQVHSEGKSQVVQYSPSAVLDSGVVVMHWFQTAIETATMILRIQTIIQNASDS